jgi:lipid-A-disaccharide synthase
MRLFISAGEPSGDLHAANLVRSIRAVVPEAEFTGFGGPQMARAGVDLIYPLTDLAVMWFAQVFQHLRTFFRLAKQAEDIFRDQKPDALVIVDYPGFHWHLARRAKKHGVPVIYFVPPQLWAWAGWRIRKVRRNVDLALCSLAFEPAWYRERGYESAEFVGHPFFDEVAHRRVDVDFLGEQQAHVGPTVAILPGSRTLEIQRNLPAMLRAAARVRAERGDVRFVVACLHGRHAALVRGTAERLHREAAAGRRPAVLDPAELDVFVGRTPELIRLADLAWSVSGSVSLELMAEALPTVILYTIRKVDLWIARPFIRAKYITLVNLLADDEVMPEYLVDHDASPELASWALKWLGDPEARAETTRRLEQLRDRVARPGATDRAARRIAEFLGHKVAPAIYRGPHGRLRTTRPDPNADDRGESPGGLDLG